MPISQHFADELIRVDPARSFTETIDPSYGENEWSVDGWVLTAGSATVLGHAASEAMYRMGYRFYTPHLTVRPDTLPADGVTIAKGQFAVPYLKVFMNYSFGGNSALLDLEDRWQALNCADDRRRPTGHTWKVIINANQAYYDANPDLISSHGASGGGKSFVLDTPERIAANKAICVAFLRENINAFDRASFDPDDGDQHDSDIVFGFANDVVAELRATTHPNARLGLYAYAGHRAPPSFACPHLYVQVALGFNHLGIGYPALVAAWTDVCPEVALRGYGDIAAQNGFLPANSGIARRDYFNPNYDTYIASGANSLNMETSANWSKNLVAHYMMLRYCRYPETTFDAVLDDIVAQVFDDDPAARDLYGIMSDPLRRVDEFTMLAVAEAVDAMRAGSLRDDLKTYVVVCEKHLQLTAARAQNGKFASLRDGESEGRYFSRLEENLRRVYGMAQSGAIHAYAYARQMANANVSNNGRPDLNLGNDPHWRQFPKAPDLQEFDAVLHDLRLRAERPAVLDWDSTDDLVLVAVQTDPVLGTENADSFYTEGPAQFVVVNNTAGPITVTHRFDPDFNGQRTDTYAPGIHTTNIRFNATTTWSGGLVFLDAFPSVRIDPTGEGQRWVYIPMLAQGRLKLTSNVRLTLYTTAGRFDIRDKPVQEVPSGIARMDDVNTRGTHQFTNINPFVSPRHNIMLMTKALAAVEFPNFTRHGGHSAE